ncbi:glycosyltransferase family 4 protein [Geomobilimonas luticola]|uniref:Glycosyltransferase family 4 protein n=1 Tax=Geomobilimonas luticola TaxID=1114878 RepID=A0ABS5SEI5_9BACT|nr:glycosyltransferase family 4 protein [Geomobilimonas luticola]MBT0653779.1 glycosyltransferase family 4 protein [Geomobilimonas luticola]
MLAPTPYFADRGCHVRIYEEARVLMSRGHEVRIVTYHLGRDMPGIPTDRISRIPWYKKLTAGPSWHKPYLDILLFFRALKTARTFRPHLIHAHLHEGAFIGLFLKMLLRIPLLFDCQGSLTAEIIDHGFIRKETLLHRFFSALERFINGGADFIITSSGAAAADLRDNWGVPPGKVLGLMDGVNTDEFLPIPRDEARKALNNSSSTPTPPSPAGGGQSVLPPEGGGRRGARRVVHTSSSNIPPDRPLAVYLGLLNAYQGTDLLLEAITLLKKRNCPLHFLIMGFPEEPYRRKAEQMGIAELVTFTGRIDYDEAYRWLSAGDLAVSPKVSLAEANGKLFNYLACGLPTVVFDTPINREILGDAGVYARYGDVSDLAAQLEKLSGDSARRAALAAASRRKAVEEHSWQARGEELIAVYRKLIPLPP